MAKAPTPAAPKLPAQGGSFLREGNGKLNKVASTTTPPKGAAQAPAKSDKKDT